MMKKYILVFLFLFGSVTLWGKETCYSVQLLSVKGVKPTNVDMETYPQDCKDMYISKSFTIRCGCFEDMQEAKARLKTLQQSYSDALLVNTYKYRFSTTATQAQQTQSVLQQKPTITLPKEQNATQEVREKKVYTKDSQAACYSVQIIRTAKTKQNLEKLLDSSYPQECKVMAFRYSLGVRCGCKPSKKALIPLVKKLQKNYPNTKIVSTYKYRFEENYKPTIQDHKQPQPQHKKPLSKEDEELRLLLSIFLYKGDIQQGYRVAKMGVKRYPNSLYWNTKAMQLARWNGKILESMQYMKKLYSSTYNETYAKEVVDLGMDNYEYEEILPVALLKLKREFNKENLDLVIFLYKKVGEPEKIVALVKKEYLKDPQNRRNLLAIGLRTSIEIGDMEEANYFVTEIEKYNPYTIEEANLLARYYYIQRKIQKSFAALQNAKVQPNDDPKTKLKYYTLVSDVGWYLEQQKPAADASWYLIQHHEARVEDYERVATAYDKTDPEKAYESIKKGFEKFRYSYLFFTYAAKAIELHHFDDLRKSIASVDGTMPYKNDPLFWLIKAQVYAHYGKKALEVEALQTAMRLSPDNVVIKKQLLWYFMKSNNIAQLKELLTSIAEKGEIPVDLYLSFASAYFYLHDINNAAYYLDKLRLAQEQTDTIEFLFLQAFIYQIQNKPESFLSTIYQIKSKLLDEANKLPSLWEDPEFLSYYLRAIIYIEQSDSFAQKLQQFKPYLHPEDYEEISYSFAMKIDAKELAHQRYLQSTFKPLWMQFSNALDQVQHSVIEDLLYHYLDVLSAGDAIRGAKEDGQIALAQQLNFEGLDHNGYNQNMYIQQIDLSKERSDLFNLKPSYYSREPLLQKYLFLENRTYLRDNYYLYLGMQHFKNSSLDDTMLINLEDTNTFSLGLEKRFDKGSVQLDIAYNDKFATYWSYILQGHYLLSDGFDLRLKLSKGADTAESTQLYLAGKKDSIKPAFTYTFVPTFYVDVEYEYAHFYSNDDVYIGKGSYGKVAFQKSLKTGYPDLLIGGFYDYGKYEEDYTKPNGVIDNIQVNEYEVLPREFYNLGISISYGMQNSDLYTRVWRPYFQGSYYYNSDIQGYSYGFMCGYGGKVWHQDHLVIGTSYTDFVNGVGGQIFEIFLDYKFLYHLPR